MSDIKSLICSEDLSLVWWKWITATFWIGWEINGIGGDENYWAEKMMLMELKEEIDLEKWGD